ncbi:YwqJ-related putative deaminase [Cryptosporangium sp. NPDC048952]|uniref:YwqJ-related putative deaminase n=1 Tax=Cryptosporangium sp. NPDC048952 TaxID=3363961 RepID=UPI00371C6ADE
MPASAAPRPLPMTAGALIVGGMVHSHTSIRGDVAPNLHPIVARILDELPTAQRERYAGWCAEVALISDRLHDADKEAGRPVTLDEAKAALDGGQIHISRIREDGDPTHGRFQPPCRSCTVLLSEFGVTTVSA